MGRFDLDGFDGWVVIGWPYKFKGDSCDRLVDLIDEEEEEDDKFDEVWFESCEEPVEVDSLVTGGCDGFDLGCEVVVEDDGDGEEGEEGNEVESGWWREEDKSEEEEEEQSEVDGSKKAGKWFEWVVEVVKVLVLVEVEVVEEFELIGDKNWVGLIVLNNKFKFESLVDFEANEKALEPGTTPIVFCLSCSACFRCFLVWFDFDLIGSIQI